MMLDIEYADRLYRAVWQVDEKSYIQNIDDALKRLSDREQLALKLRYRDGVKYKEIGRQFGVDVARTRKIIVRALRKLREIPDININVSRLKKQEELIAEKKETVSDKDSQIAFTNQQIETLLLTGKSEQVESKKIKDVFFSTRIATVLARANITNIDDLLCINDFNAIFSIRYIGITSILEIIRIMYELGYSEWVQQTLCNTKEDLRDTLINQLAAYKKEISAHCRF